MRKPPYPILTAEARPALAASAHGVLTPRARHEGAGSGRRVLSGQPQRAPTSRVVIDQAKNVLSERHGLPMDRAFALLCRLARSHHRKLTGPAQAVVDRTAAPARRPRAHPPSDRRGREAEGPAGSVDPAGPRAHCA
ncbi:ANTAR domain-containing protein [Nonomuraea fastidiosa]|uniref:ANTAR domain-containing protein n=1 Tax=Nonomuraea TaxID=83681 RepID=UPI00324E6F34